MKNILLLQTGGTIAMHLNDDGPELDAGRWSDVLHKEIPQLSQIANLDIESLFFEDSSDIHKTHWDLLGKTIYERYDRYDGFVVLHGTDTMAYTGSALSFALRNPGKPVIFTGSQVPMSNIRSDAPRNLVNAVELATHPIHEVAICFNDHLYRANRSTKMSIGDFDAFASPNAPPLAEVGIEIKRSASIQQNSGKPDFLPGFDSSIHLLKLYPGLEPRLLDCLDLDRIRTVIIEAFGSGNIPVKNDVNLLPFIEKCKKHGCHVIITSQAPYDAVDLELYASGRMARDLGALSAGEMTTEATVTKTMHLLSRELAVDQFNSQFTANLAGERSGPRIS